MYSFRQIKLNNLNEELYNKFFYCTKDSSPFLSLSWLKSITHSSYSYSLKFLEISQFDSVVGYLPYFEKFYGLIKLCNVWGGYGGYVSIKKLELNKVFCLCVFKQYKYKDNVLKSSLFLHKEKLSTWIKIINTPYDITFSALHKKTKNQIRKANKSDLLYIDVKSITMVEECYSIYRMLVKKHNITTVLSIETFHSLSKFDDVDFIASISKGKVIAYSVFLYSNTECFYWLNASNPNYSTLNATNGMLDKIIFKLSGSTINVLNFGAVPLDNTGLHHFKSRWGAIEREYVCETGIML
ncbi:MAG: hypothetical protein OFPII_24810 [Osedax symbiont Rs1]|nr:MAG: hypothetical protein OFPII_24810 [Osedax symbiont Rs1]